MDLATKYEVPESQVCWHCNAADFSFECTDELTPLQGFIGQDRALDAMQFGLELDKPGYNLFVTGLTGTGKASAIKTHLQAVIDERKAKGTQFPIYDWCYVHNFGDPDRPQILRLAPSQGKLLNQGLDQLLTTLRAELPKVFASEEYTSQRKEVEEAGRTEYQTQLRELEREARDDSFGLQITPAGVNIFPLSAEGQPYSPEEFMTMEEDAKSAIDEKRAKLLERVQETMEQLRSIEKGTQDKIRELDRQVGDLKLSDLFFGLTQTFKDLPEVSGYLNALKEYSLNNLGIFNEEASQASPAPVPGGAHPPPPAIAQRNPFLPFETNVIVDNSTAQAAPIIIESNPTWGNLFGTIDRRAFMGTYFSDHTMLKPGAIHNANGGYLVLNVRDLLMNTGVWEGLKRVVRDREVRLEDPAVQLGAMAPQGLRPQPMPWDAKVVVTGDEAAYRTLSTYDKEDFWEMFKVKAEFDSQIDLTPQAVGDYCGFIHSTCHSEGIFHCDRTAVARIIEYGARLVADQTKLSARFGLLKDVLIEGDYWARKEG